MKYLLLFTIVISVIGCKDSPKKNALFSSMDAEKTGITFKNTVNNLHDFNIFGYRNFYNGGGVAVGDVNNDGFQDVLFTSNMGDNKLYINKGNFTFTDITEKAGIADSNKWSTGASMVDINNDGWIDIYICNAGYRKESNTKNTLFINNGDQTFTESAAAYGLDEDGYTTHAAFFDFDQDGDLDVYILNNSFIPVNTLNYSNKRELRARDWPVMDFLKGGGDKLLRNDNGKFIDVSEKAGIYGSLIGFGLGVTVGDVDGDYLPDIYVSNDFFERDYLYINKGDGTFSEELEARMGHISMSSMGADMADINNDGCPEIFVTDMLPYSEQRLKTTSSFDNINVKNLMVNNGFYHQYMQNSLQLNDCEGKFKEIAYYSGVAASDWSWGALMFDADQDMLTDIFVCNGIYHDVTDQDFIDFFANEVIQNMVMTGEKEQLDSVINRMPSKAIQNMAFRNKGDLTFDVVSDDWGFSETTFSNGAAYADLDNDGDLDLLINNVNQPALVYKNNSRELTKNNFLGVNLKGEKPNIDAIGTVAHVYTDGKVMRREHIPNRGFQSSMDMRLNFGLGQLTKVDSIILFWPDRTQRTVINPEINTYHTIVKSEGNNIKISAKRKQNQIFSEIDVDLEKHTEDDFIDFYYERNTPMMLSKEGPKMAVSDINKDGFDDLYICGAAGQEGQLYLGSSKGLTRKKLPIFKQFTAWEDTEALFFDANGDGNMDLFVGSGGNNGPPGIIEMQDRLYFNSSNGDFNIDYKALPLNGMNTSKAIALDYDLDGDMDLFVASRSYPGEYGMDPQNFMYENLGQGKFREVLTPTKSALAFIGMITDVEWVNVDGSDGSELVVVGEWMAPRIFKFNGVTFIEVDTNLKPYTGMWQSITSADIDKDGDMDLILGNIGSNGYLFDEKKLPVKVYIKDFDNNGMPEKILTRTIDSKDMTVVMKREMVDQLSMLKKKNLKHHDYANKNIHELLGGAIENALVRSFSHVKSEIAINDGKGNFTLSSLPMEVQLSSANDILVTEINDDNYLDLIIVGNKTGFQAQFGQLDCNPGLVLFNDTKGGFVVKKNAETGISISGVSKQIMNIRQNGKELFIVARNNEKPYIFVKNEK